MSRVRDWPLFFDLSVLGRLPGMINIRGMIESEALRHKSWSSPRSRHYPAIRCDKIEASARAAGPPNPDNNLVGAAHGAGRIESSPDAKPNSNTSSYFLRAMLSGIEPSYTYYIVRLLTMS